MLSAFVFRLLFAVSTPDSFSDFKIPVETLTAPYEIMKVRLSEFDLLLELSLSFSLLVFPGNCFTLVVVLFTFAYCDFNFAFPVPKIYTCRYDGIATFLSVFFKPFNFFFMQ